MSCGVNEHSLLVTQSLLSAANQQFNFLWEEILLRSESVYLSYSLQGSSQAFYDFYIILTEWVYELHTDSYKVFGTAWIKCLCETFNFNSH